MEKLSIDVVSDLICPWCFIGARRLEQALAAPETAQALEKRGVAASVTFHPFLLDPSIPADGVDLRRRLKEKYGAEPRTMFARVESVAQSSGIPLDFEKVTRMASTVDGHTLLRHAVDRGTQGALAHDLFAAYFLEGRDIGAADVLASIAEKHGFSADEAFGLVRDDDERRRTRAEAAEAARSGISGVPFFIFDRRLAVSGAQSVEVLQGAIARALEGLLDASGANPQQ